MRINLLSLGCPKNAADSEALLCGLRREGIYFADDPEESDAILVNTCGFIEDAKRESISEILKMSGLKAKGKRKRKLIVFGCLAKRYKDELAREIPEIDAVFGVGEDEAIAAYLKSLMPSKPERRPDVMREASSIFYKTGAAPVSVPLKITEGCSRGCTFCVIPSIRGPLVSLPPDGVLKAAESHVKNNVRELVIVGQDITSYNYKGYTLPRLVKEISEVNGDFWIRLLYLYPDGIGDELLDAMAGGDKICKYLDLPLQHTEDRILKAMARKGTRKGYSGLIKKIRSSVPGVALRTTLIVGFPGETEEEFSSMLEFVEDAAFDRLGAFKYSIEEGTPAARLKGRVNKAAINSRYDRLMRIQAGISLGKNTAMIGRGFRALIEETGSGALPAMGRIYSQAEEIDGVTLISAPADKMPKRGEFKDIVIARASEYDLEGVLG